ncbi:MAG: GTP cyclohydrolase, FolE2/MptA family [bacterium]
MAIIPINILNFSEVSKLLRDLQNNLQEKNVHLSIKFKLLIYKEAPITKQTGFVSYDCEYIGKKISKKTKIYLKVRVPVTTLCPGSKAVSTFGAHNQRGFITVIVEAVEEVSFIDLIYYAEKFGASCEIFTNVKREDEKFMTEKAFQNAKFVEDSVRSVVEQLKYDKRFKGYYVSCQNMDSIHLHDTFAEVNKLIW